MSSARLYVICNRVTIRLTLRIDSSGGESPQHTCNQSALKIRKRQGLTQVKVTRQGQPIGRAHCARSCLTIFSPTHPHLVDIYVFPFPSVSGRARLVVSVSLACLVGSQLCLPTCMLACRRLVSRRTRVSSPINTARVTLSRNGTTNRYIHHSTSDY